MKLKKYIFPILMGFSMSILMSFKNTGGISFPHILFMMALQAFIASMANLIFPAGMFGAKLVKKNFKDISYIPFLLLSSLIPAIYFTMIMSLSGMLIMIGFSKKLIGLYLLSLPSNIFYGYIISLFWNVLIDFFIKNKSQ